MRVEILEDRISDGDPDTGQHYQVAKGDTITVPDAVGKRWCGYGWAADVAKKVKTGERIPGAREIVVQNSKLGGR